MKFNFLSKTFFLLLSSIFIFTSCKSDKTDNDQKKLNTTRLTVTKDTDTPDTLIVYPYKAAYSLEEYKEMTQKWPIDNKQLIVQIDTARTLRRIAIKTKDTTLFAEIFTGPGNFQINMENNSLKINGPALHKEYNEIDTLMGRSKYQKIKYQSESTLSQEDLLLKKQYPKKLISSINSFPDSYPLLFMVSEHYWYADLDTIDLIVNSFDKQLQNNYHLKKIIQRKKDLENTQIGSEAPSFSLESFEGTQINLEDYKGKYVLLDYWASWCAPCKRGIPRLKKIRSEYPEEQFVILSISIDADLDSWKKEVLKQEMPWPQLHMGDSQVNDRYGVTGIPHFFLISPEGKIEYSHIGENHEIEKELEKYLGSQSSS